MVLGGVGMIEGVLVYFLCTMGDWDRVWWCGNGVRGVGMIEGV